MNLRLTLYALAAQHGLTPHDAERLQGLGTEGAEPSGVGRMLPRVLSVLAAALGGLAVILWIAANWEDFGRAGRFAILQTWVLAMGVAAAWQASLRVPAGLLALLGIGALFAYFGQTYQTGADPWQLFALWAVLALPLCWGARSDVLWAPWALVAMTGVALWVDVHVSHRWWQPHQADLLSHALGWAMASLVVLGLGPLLQRYTSAGVWSHRLAVVLLVVMVSVSGLSGLFQREMGGLYGLALLLLAGLAAWLASRMAFDVFGLSAVALALNVLLSCGFWRVVFEGHHGGDWVGQFLLLGVVSAGLLAASVTGVLRLSQHYAAADVRAAYEGGAA